MAKETFYNLTEEKRNRILEVLKDEFKKKAFQDVNVKTIVERLNIARGSFYQYFDDLEDSYFTILDSETIDIHRLFMEIFQKEDFDLYNSLKLYGLKIGEIIFNSDSYMIYKNRYLYWNEGLNRRWLSCHKDYHTDFQTNNSKANIDFEKIEFIKAIVHSLIKRIFQENWSKEDFLEKFEKHINWIKKGVM